MESEYIIPDVPDGEEFEMPPVAPKRVRRRSKSSRGASLLEDEDRTSHAASSLPAEEAPPHIDIGDMGGYASVVKPVPIKPDRPRKPKPARPPPPGRRKKSSGSKLSHFFSLPRKPPPLRPIRNYSTLGPSRPPRRERVDEPRFMAQYDQSEPYNEIEGEDADQLPQEGSQDSSRDLQSGDIIEKMKGRPLPPPPRPPRKSKEGRDTLSQFGEEDMGEVQEDVALAALRDDVFYSQKGSVSSLQHERLRAEAMNMAQKMSLDPEEITVSMQTDPLIDEYCEDLVDGEPLKELVRTIELEERGKLPKEEEKPDQSLFYPKERSAPTAEPRPREEEIIESAVLGRLVCRSEASPESTVLEQEARKSPAITKSKTPPVEIITERIIERHIPYHVGPDENTEVELLRTQRLQVSELDVERLNVGELQAQKILVSDIDGVSMQLAELTSKSGNLVVSGIELPPGFVQELYDARPSQPTHVILECSSTQTVEEPQQVSVAAMEEETQKQERSQAISGTQPQEGIPASQAQATFFPPAAQQYGGPQFGSLSMAPPGMHFVPAGSYMETYQEYSPPVPPPPRMSSRQRARELESEDEVVGVVPRRRRHLAKPVSRYSSDEEEEEEPVGRGTPQFHAPSRRHGVKSSDVPAVELARQLLQRLEVTPAGRWVRRAWAVVAPSSEERRRDLQTALCVLLVLLALLILLGFGSGKTFHHHHWDYYFPPPI
ncbi:hypothetical protein PR048_032108 [Dryococelus australis]|uniref:Uncharacterized protein n=1 Tax=Dryococelus australis TaxID=614101 RepID=A0ABQ9G1A4_9NEOP|nr:hypothetical protein PR048_032108 [Dryococelus australis]